MFETELVLSAISGANLMDLEFMLQEFVVHGLLPNGLSILGGAPKIGKSWLRNLRYVWLTESLCGTWKPSKARCCITVWRTPCNAFNSACIASQRMRRTICCLKPLASFLLVI